MIEAPDFDCEREAEGAMRMAAATTALERLNWVRIALAWQDLQRRRDGRAAEESKRPLPAGYCVPWERLAEQSPLSVDLPRDVSWD